jgi:hypothetical protein
MFEEIYYWIYFYLKRIKTNDTPAFNAYLLICTIQFFNFGTLLVLIDYFWKVEYEKNTVMCMELLVAGALCILNYFLFYSKREVIFLKYIDLIPQRRVRGKIFFWIYILFSFSIFFISVANLVKLK